MMNNSYKKDILKNIIGSKGVTLGTPQANNTVKFCFTTNLATAATNNTAGALTFAVDANGNAGIWAQGSLVSSKIQDISTAAASGNKHGGKTVTVTYIVANTGATDTHTFDVIDEAALEAYFANSKTIALDAETNRYEVKTKANGGIAVDTEGAGLYAVLSDIFGVDGNTIGFKSDNKTIESLIKIVYIDGQSEGNTGNDRIALTDKNGVELTHVDVQDIIGGGIVSNVVYNPDNNSLTIYWIGGATTTIDLSKLFDISDWAVETGSENFLHLAIDASTAKIGVKKADVTYTASADNNPANLTVDTTNGEILVASDAIPAIKNYVDAQSADLAVEAASRNSYIDSSVIAENNKKVWVAAQVAELTITKEDEADTTITGIAGKLVDASDTAAKVQSFVNARISEEISKLDSSIVFNDGNYISAGFKEVDGKLNGVWVNNTYGAFGTPTHNGTAISATAATDGIAKAENVQAFVIDAIKVLDASLNATTTDISIYLEQVDGKVTSIGLEHSVANVTFTAKDGNTPANLTGTGSFVMASDIEAIRNYVDAVAAAGFDDLDSQVVEKDNDGLVTVTTGIVNGKLFDASCSVALTRGALDASFGTITATTDGLITAREMADSVTTALKWHIL